MFSASLLKGDHKRAHLFFSDLLEISTELRQKLGIAYSLEGMGSLENARHD